MNAPWKRMYFLTPTFRPAGGVIKIFDYVNHALALGYEVVICCSEVYEPDLPLFQIERFRAIAPTNAIRFTHPKRIIVGPKEFAFFSSPRDYQYLETRLSPETKHEQVIHILQNVRHRNPSFADGYAIRLLSRPMTRIVINEVVLAAVRPYLNLTSLTEVILIGHNSQFFSRERTGGFGKPVKVAYTTWKSEVGDQIASAEGGLLSGFKFKAIRNSVSWDDLKELYHWADIFLATPDPEEGFYLPGLEAMAAGAIVLSPDAGGNRAYCQFGENCVFVELNDVTSYGKALQSLRDTPTDAIEQLRQRGYDTIQKFSLSREQEEFGNLLERLKIRFEHPERRESKASPEMASTSEAPQLLHT